MWTKAIDSLPGSMVLLNAWWALSAIFPGAEPPTYGFRMLHKLPHDRMAFTQGLCYEQDGQVLESTGMPPYFASSRHPGLSSVHTCADLNRNCAGLYGESTVRRVQLRNGQVLRQERLPDEWFGEGVAAHSKSCWQLLWREGLLLERDRKSFKLRRSVEMPRGIEGWGLTHDGINTLYASDGRHAPLPSALVEDLCTCVSCIPDRASAKLPDGQTS